MLVVGGLRGCSSGGYWALTGFDTNKGPSIDVFWTRLHRTRTIGRVVCIHVRWTRVALPTGPGARTPVSRVRIGWRPGVVLQVLRRTLGRSGRNELGSGRRWHGTSGRGWGWRRLLVHVFRRAGHAGWCRVVPSARVVLGKLWIEVGRRWVRVGVVHLRRVLAVGRGRVVVWRQVWWRTVHLDGPRVQVRGTGGAVPVSGSGGGRGCGLL